MNRPTCACGCGSPTTLVKQTSARRGIVKGQYNRFVVGHANRSSAVDYVVEPISGCWNWQRHRNDKGYGQTFFRGKLWLAHRVAYVRAFGDLPNYVVIRHDCDNRACVNPSHLRLGTQADNIADCVAKGRNQRGETNGHAKLTAAQVIEIRAADWRGVTRRQIGRRYGVSPATISRVLIGSHWKSVEC